jgi:hypothetical protein
LKLVNVSATDIAIAAHISPSSHPNCRDDHLPAALITTVTNARAGKKKVIKSAKFWSPLVGLGCNEAMLVEDAAICVLESMPVEFDKQDP